MGIIDDFWRSFYHDLVLNNHSPFPVGDSVDNFHLSVFISNLFGTWAVWFWAFGDDLEFIEYKSAPNEVIDVCVASGCIILTWLYIYEILCIYIIYIRGTHINYQSYKHKHCPVLSESNWKLAIFTITTSRYQSKLLSFIFGLGCAGSAVSGSGFE